MDGIDTFDSPLLADVQLNSDGTLKQSGKQNVKFYKKKRLSFKARPLWVKQDDGTPVVDAKGNPIQAKDKDGRPLFDIDPKTGIPYKDAFEEWVTMVRVETKGDTTIKEDVADNFIKRQFYRQYKYFHEGKIPDGHPIEDFEFLQPGTLLELRMLGVYTLEQVAEMSDVTCQQIQDQSGFEIRDVAQQWIKINSPDSKNARADMLALENMRLKRELEAMKHGRRINRPELGDVGGEEELRILQADASPEVEVMEISPEQLKRGPGRPRKV